MAKKIDPIIRRFNVSLTAKSEAHIRSLRRKTNIGPDAEIVRYALFAADELVDQSSDLANRAIKRLSDPMTATAKQINAAVLNACVEYPDMVAQDVIDRAVARIKAAKHYAERKAAQQ